MDNDHLIADLRRHLQAEVGSERAERYWKFFEQLRDELGYADYLGALQRYRTAYPRDLRILTVSHFLVDYPFADRVLPRAFDVIQEVKNSGAIPVILSDGDVVFQPLKVERSGLLRAVEKALIYVHKEKELEDVEARFPARRYVLVDDKLRILTAVKKIWGQRVTTVFVKQGHYATDPDVLKNYPPADVTLERIGDLQSDRISLASGCS